MPHTSLRSEYLYKYGVAGAGAVWQSFIGRLPAGVLREIGPVVGVSPRVASRIANALKAGAPARDPAALRDCRTTLLYAPPDQAAGLIAALASSAMDWRDRPIVVCDCSLSPAVLAPLTEPGARIAWLSDFGVPGYVAIRGAESTARNASRAIARQLRLRAITVPPGAECRFDAALTLSSAAFTPLIDNVAQLLRNAGARETEAPRLAAALLRQTAADYAHYGRPSWAWHIHEPDPEALERQIAATDPATAEIFRLLLQLGFNAFEKHAEIGRALRRNTVRNPESA